LERRTREWNKLGAREEDALLRAARKPLPDIEKMERFAAELADGDAQRAKVVIECSRDAIEAAESIHGN
jgi:hypothetical protein